MMNNILVLSCGTRNKVIQYFKKALTAKDGSRTGRVIATDMSAIAPAIYEADAYYIVPRMTAEGYIDVIFDICQKEKITAFRIVQQLLFCLGSFLHIKVAFIFFL